LILCFTTQNHPLRYGTGSSSLRKPYGTKVLRFYNFASCGQCASEEGPVLYWIPY
jgi:hypothetical protein